MIAGGLSLFGFDLFGLSRRAPGKADTESTERTPLEKVREDGDKNRDPDREHSESFFWGMYPVY
ncbi:hypothetical protein [Neorhizobium galegae]|uniref:Uncharacterized protein n=1 Tax=Neorhizobium galegae bv. orientalis str. HAMBI 540 TaxID=1028800 RepID=A0A068SWK9_NEOGA|nr:hypothetical protein [Neorhizobium galegae]MCQ1852072.1 hypothetical protein [Neorhizobium galegae]CDN50687.1 Hypothetical protein RG540_PA00080 [Neorhizobium galegae bv. orientalis str. HAMBI 540]CDZ43559.1 Hypothetical protein NGAL_HAMBI2427_01920 [Neorhizobium galegae bv. orientalis]